MRNHENGVESVTAGPEFMDLNKQKEQFSIAYVRAVVTAAGYNVYKMEVDEDSVLIWASRLPRLSICRSAHGLICNSNALPTKKYCTTSSFTSR
jgi:hypothetical protein